METLGLLAHGFSTALTPENLFATFIGCLLGQFIGILPGIGPAAGIALLLPITFGVKATTALMMLSGIMYGAMYGGTLTSVLINVPGEAASVMTAVDGYQLAKQGRAGAALSVAAIGSFLAGIGAVLLLAFLCPILGDFALKFNAPEFFLLATLGLTMTASLGSGSAVKALLMAVFGIMVALVGTDPMVGTVRLTFGELELMDGIDFIPVAVGIFGIGEVLSSLEPSQADVIPIKTKLKDLWLTAKDWADCRMAILRGGVVGFLVGLMPGVGPVVASMLAYVIERRCSKHPERFGKGALDAVAAAESANNSAVHGAMVPMLALGIPGSAATAVLLAALVLLGIRPGPMLMTQQADLVWGLIASMLIGNIMLIFMNLPFAPAFAMVLRVPYDYLAPGILVVSLVGAFATTLSLFNVGITIFFGIIGYLMMKFNLPRAPIVLAIVLAPMMESALRQSLMLSSGSPMIFIQRPIAAVLLVLVFVSLSLPFFRRKNVEAKGDELDGTI
ncbi:MAG: tripartite tricarboxylate transporter permease [Deltaproteobacteria bacterium]